MGNATSLFGQWLIERGISLADYVELPRERKVALQDAYDSDDWRKKSHEAEAALAAIPRDFFVWLGAQHNMGRDDFDKLSAQNQMQLANEHGYALSQAAQKQKAATQKPLALPENIRNMPDGSSKDRMILDYVNRKALEEGGYIPRGECAA